MKKLIVPGAVWFLAVCNACWMTDECGAEGSGCHDSVKVWCENGNDAEPFEYDCAQEDLTCAQINNNEYDCVLPCSKSEVGLVVDAACKDSMTLDGFFCAENSHWLMANSGAHYYYQYNTMNCEHGCEDNVCIKLHPDEYDSCDGRYVSSCAGDVVGYCEGGTVHVRDCRMERKDGDPMVCVIIDNEATCEKSCNPGHFGAPKYACDTRDGQSYSVMQSCENDGYADFVWTDEEQCPLGCDETTGQCKGQTVVCPSECPNDCDSNGVCNTHPVVCPSECPDDCDANGVCNLHVVCPSECPDDCDSNGVCNTHPVVCPSECPNDCDSDGVCIDHSGDVDVVTDAPCDWSMTEYCEDNHGYFCNGTNVVKRSCAKAGTDLICRKLKDENMVDCVAPCDPDNFESRTSCDGKYVATHLCEEVAGGGYYEFSFTNDPCPVDCRDGYCVTGELPEIGASCDASFVPQCMGPDGYNCVDGQVTKSTCDGDLHCALEFGASATACASECNAAEDVYTCSDSITTDNRICRLGTDLKYHLFVQQESCKSSCADGVCDIEIPTVGESCDFDNFDDVCIKNVAYYCQSESHIYQAMVCGKGDYIGQPLCRYLSETYADCVSPCEEGDEGIMGCGGSAKKGYYTDNYICKRGLDGNFYLFNEQEPCSGTCKNGVCQ